MSNTYNNYRESLIDFNTSLINTVPFANLDNITLDDVGNVTYNGVSGVEYKLKFSVSIDCHDSHGLTVTAIRVSEVGETNLLSITLTKEQVQLYKHLIYNIAQLDDNYVSTPVIHDHKESNLQQLVTNKLKRDVTDYLNLLAITISTKLDSKPDDEFVYTNNDGICVTIQKHVARGINIRLSTGESFGIPATMSINCALSTLLESQSNNTPVVDTTVLIITALEELFIPDVIWLRRQITSGVKDVSLIDNLNMDCDALLMHLDSLNTMAETIDMNDDTIVIKRHTQPGVDSVLIKYDITHGVLIEPKTTIIYQLYRQLAYTTARNDIVQAGIKIATYLAHRGVSEKKPIVKVMEITTHVEDN